MATPERTTVLSVFATQTQAEQAIADLRSLGVSDEHVSLIAPRQPGAEREPGPSGPPTVETGAGIGGLTGAALGGLVTGGFLGMAAVGIAGGLLGALIDLGIPETDARFFQAELGVGRYLLATRTDRPFEEIAAILRRHGASEVRRQTSSDVI